MTHNLYLKKKVYTIKHKNGNKNYLQKYPWKYNYEEGFNFYSFSDNFL